MVTTSVSSTPNPEPNPKRPPLLPSETANNVPRHHRPRQVTSRYMSSPSISKSPMPPSGEPVRASPMIKRAVSVERIRRTPMNAEKILMTTSTRSLSVSFQGEPFKLNVSKAKGAPTPVAATGDSLRPKTGDRWTGRMKALNSSIPTRRLDFDVDKSKLSEYDNAVRFSKNCMIDNGKINDKSTDSVVSDSDTVPSGSGVGGSVGKVRGGTRCVVVPSRFLENTSSRLRKEVESNCGSLKSKNDEFKKPSSPIGTKKFLQERPVSVSKVEGVTGRFAMPIRGGRNVVSVNKGLWTPMKDLSPRGEPRGPSPMRMRIGGPNQSRNSAIPSVLSLRGDVGRVRVAESRVSDEHELRMLYNRHLQWRFVNARAEAAHLAQSETAERSLFNAWLTISKLRNSIASKKIQLQLLTQNLKLYSILKEQVPYLESWSLINQDHCISLSKAREALETSIANIPLVNGARADIQLLEKAICSAADVMRGMTSSVGSHLIMAEQVSLLASELANTAANEIALIEQGKSLLSELDTLQVNDSSLRAHILQLPETHQA